MGWNVGWTNGRTGSETPGSLPSHAAHADVEGIQLGLKIVAQRPAPGSMERLKHTLGKARKCAARGRRSHSIILREVRADKDDRRHWRR